jgi:hypothetical protein
VDNTRSGRFTPGIVTTVPNEQEAGMTPELFWTFIGSGSSFFLPVFEPQTVQSVATHNTDCTQHLKYLSTAQYRDDVSL